MKLFTKAFQYIYNESGQVSPVRFAVVEKKGEDFYQQHCVFKCKDYLNDIVYTYNTKNPIVVYGLDTDKLKLPEKGQPLFLAIFYAGASFENNFALVNEYLKKKKHPEVVIHQVEKVAGDPLTIGSTHTYVLEVPEFFLKNTYNISLLSFFIRLCTYEALVFETFKELCECKKYGDYDNKYIQEVVKAKIFFDFDDEGYIWYAGPTYNDRVKISTYDQVVLHCNGFRNWMTSFPGLKNVEKVVDEDWEPDEPEDDWGDDDESYPDCSCNYCREARGELV